MIGFIVAGLVIGAFARLIKPGRQHLSVLLTLLLGLAGSVIGGLVANRRIWSRPLGAVAARSLIGPKFRVTKQRGQ